MVSHTPLKSVLVPLDKKLFRDLYRVKGQALAIAVVIALGVLMLVMMQGLVNSLEETKRAYYERYRLAEVFASLKRAPKNILEKISSVPGIAAVEGRINGGALINLPDVAVPIRTIAISLPDHGEPRLNDIYLSQGRRINPAYEDEIILLAGFANAHEIELGHKLSATMNGARRTFTVVGFAQAPEFLYSAPPGDFVPDDARFAVIWMSEQALAAAYDLKGAFNEVLATTKRGTELPAVLGKIDNILDAYGGIGAYGLTDQFSNRFIVDEIKGLRISSRTVPPIFLAVAAFLLYIVISRMIEAEREQIGLLKAFGFTNKEVGGHYFSFILVIAIGGALLGCILGVIAGRSLAVVYGTYYKFPFLLFQVDPGSFVSGFVVSVLSASAGGLLVLRKVFSLTPAVAMQPPAPADYSKSAGLSHALKSALDQPSRMVVRRLIRQPWRATAAVVGIGAGMALSVSMLSVMSSFDAILDLNFRVIDRSDVTLSFIEPLSDKSIYELRRMRGVISTEPVRTVPALFRNGIYSYRGSINGMVSEPKLYRAVNKNMETIYIREEGIIIAKSLSQILNIRPGELLSVEVRYGRRPILELPVIGIAESLLGSPAYMEIDALNTALKEPNRVSGAYLKIDEAFSNTIYHDTKNMPSVAGVSLRNETRAAFRELIDSGAGAVRFIMTAIAGIITFGIIYNSARIAFSERSRDLASLRVLGFTKGETAFILLGELAVITLLALPLGAGLGYLLSLAVSQAFSTDLYQIPAIFVPKSYGLATLAVIFASAVSGWLVKRDIDKIDLVSALKTRE